MILTCPICSTRYTVSADQVPAAGRNVRCVKCGHTWLQMPPQDENPPDADLRARLAARTPMGAGRTGDEDDGPSVWEKAILGVGWTGLALIVLLIAWAGYTYRQVVQESWPQSASVYAALGMSDKTDLALQLDPYQRKVVDGHGVLIISGAVRNTTDREMVVPDLRAFLSDATGKELAHWSVAPEALTLKPGQSTRFATRFHNPPEAARHFEIRFAAAD